MVSCTTIITDANEKLYSQDGEENIPSVAVRQKDMVLFQLSAKGLQWYVLSLPSCGIIICLIVSLIYDFEKSNSTHCGPEVINFLPSVSAAIGRSTPQRYISRICIGLHAAPRLMIAIAYYNYYNSFNIRKNKKLFKTLTVVNSSLHIFENLCLLGLTCVASNENFKLHKLLFIGFLSCAQLYTVLTLFLFKKCHAISGMDYIQRKSFNWKKRLGFFNVCVMVIAAYTYWRHYNYCEPGMYSLCSLCEYCIVASNIIFNGTFAFDMGNTQLQICHTREREQPKFLKYEEHSI